MLQIRCYLYLTQESIDAEYGAEVGSQDLDCDVALVLYVAGAVHGGHPAFTDKAFDDVAIRECFCELLVCRQCDSLQRGFRQNIYLPAPLHDARTT